MFDYYSRNRVFFKKLLSFSSEDTRSRTLGRCLNRLSSSSNARWANPKRFYDNFKQLESQLNGLLNGTEDTRSDDLSQFQKNVENTRFELEEVLYRLDVTPYEECLETLDRKLHKTIGTKPADTPEQDGKVAEVHKTGFHWEDRVDVIQGLEQNQKEDESIKFDDFKLGECTVPLPSGSPEGTSARVTYKYNLDQTLEVTVEGPDGRTANVTIERPTLDEAEVAEATMHLQHLEVE